MCMRCYLKVSRLSLALQEEKWYGVLPTDGDRVHYCQQSDARLAHLARFTVNLSAFK
jgi:hypothetical protein